MPCVGISFGVDRIFTILAARRERMISAVVRDIDVYVMAVGGEDIDGLLLERMTIARLLWNAGIRAEYAAKVKAKLPQQLKAATRVPLAVILDREEWAVGLVRVRTFRAAGGGETTEEDRGQLISKDTLVAEVKGLLSR